MSKIKYEVEKIDLRKPDELQDKLDQGAAKGLSLVTTAPMKNDYLVLVWQKPGQEQRG